MKNYFIVLLFAGILMASCAPQHKSLYSWDKYEEESYDYVKNMTDKSLDDLMLSYENIINKQKGTRETVPPGICADYGYLLVKKGKKAEGIEMLKKEIALYPESGVFMSRIIKKLEE